MHIRDDRNQRRRRDRAAATLETIATDCSYLVWQRVRASLKSALGRIDLDLGWHAVRPRQRHYDRKLPGASSKLIN
jgi:hypothetical protein